MSGMAMLREILRKRAVSFARGEDGSSTEEWVVISAFAVALSAILMIEVSNTTTGVAESISADVGMGSSVDIAAYNSNDSDAGSDDYSSHDWDDGDSGWDEPADQNGDAGASSGGESAAPAATGGSASPAERKASTGRRRFPPAPSAPAPTSATRPGCEATAASRRASTSSR